LTFDIVVCRKDVVISDQLACHPQKLTCPLHAAKAGALLMIVFLSKATEPAKILDGHARTSLFEKADEWHIGKSGLFLSHHFPKSAVFAPSNCAAGREHVAITILTILYQSI
jgi:hypothetical protein